MKIPKISVELTSSSGGPPPDTLQYTITCSLASGDIFQIPSRLNRRSPSHGVRAPHMFGPLARPLNLPLRISSLSPLSAIGANIAAGSTAVGLVAGKYRNIAFLRAVSPTSQGAVSFSPATTVQVGDTIQLFEDQNGQSPENAFPRPNLPFMWLDDGTATFIAFSSETHLFNGGRVRALTEGINGTYGIHPVLPVHIIGALGGSLSVYDRAGIVAGAPTFWSTTASAAVAGAVQIDRLNRAIPQTDSDFVGTPGAWVLPNGKLGKPVIPSASIGIAVNGTPPTARLYQRGEDWSGESYAGFMIPR